MLEKEQFLAIKKLANDLRKDNEDVLKSFDEKSVDEAINDKNQFIESLIDKMGIEFSEGEKGKEESQVFRANLLIPDDVEFFEEYSKDKNIRNLMNKYAVSLEDIMSKITELNVYSKFINTFNEEAETEPEPKPEPQPEPQLEPVMETITEDSLDNISSQEAENLLDEIEDLSSSIDELNIPSEKEEISVPAYEPEPVHIQEPVTSIIEEITPEPEIETVNFEETEDKKEELQITDEIENIGTAVSDFVDEYTKVKKELEFTQAKINKFNSEKEEIRKQYVALKEEKEVLEKENAVINVEIEKLRSDSERLVTENKELSEKLEVMEKNAKQSSDLLKEIYNSIPKKRFNVKEG